MEMIIKIGVVSLDVDKYIILCRQNQQLIRYLMHSLNSHDLSNSYGCILPPQQHFVHYIYIFQKENINADQIKSIKPKMDNEVYLCPIGHSMKEYLQIEKSLKREQEKSHKRKNITLVGDIESCSKILAMKQNQRRLNFFNEVYVCYKEESVQSLELLEKYSIINKKEHDLDKIILKAKQFMKKTEPNLKILRNFICLAGKYRKQSYLMKVRANGCIHLPQSQFQKYKQKFFSYLQKQSVTNVKNNTQISSDESEGRLKEQGGFKIQLINKMEQKVTLHINRALKQYRDKKYQQFRQTIINLYQEQTVFYEILNKSLMNFTDRKFKWQAVALPFCLLFKAIKMSLGVQSINNLFGFWKDEIDLYRGARIGEKQQLQLRENKDSKYFYQMRSFVSTSLKKKKAYEFLDNKFTKNNCLLHFKLKKPKSKQQIDNFSFIYQSFAKLPNNRDGKTINEDQVLLNALSICRLVSVHKIKYSDIKQTDRFKDIHGTLPVFVFEVGGFEDLLYRYNKKDKGTLSQYERSVVQNYLLMVDNLKNYQNFDIGHSLLLSGDLKAAYQHDISKIKQLQLEESQHYQSQQDKMKNKKKYHEVCHRLANTCFNLGKQEEALNYIEISIQTYKMIENLDKSRTLKQHQQFVNRMYQEASQMLQSFHRTAEACKQIQDRIEHFQKLSKLQQQKKQLYQFLIAQLLVDLGIIQVRQGRFLEAHNYLLKGKTIMEKIMKQIDYEGLKTQNFRFSFFFHWLTSKLTSKEVIWDDKETYYKKRRAMNIEQATYIFGGQMKFQRVVSSTHRLKDQLKAYLSKNITEAQHNGENNSLAKINIIDKMQKEFQNHPLTEEIKPELNQFIDEFKSSLVREDADQAGGIQKKYKELIDLIIKVSQKIQKADKSKKYLDGEQNKQQKQIVLKRDELISQKLYDWQKIDYINNETAIKLKNKIDDYIILMKKRQLQMLHKHNIKDKNTYKNHLKSMRSSIQSYLMEQENWGFSNPGLSIISKKFLNSQLYQLQGNQTLALKQIQDIIEDSKKNSNFIVQLLDAQFLSIKLHYSIADFDFISCIQVKSLKGQNINVIQKQELKKCEDRIKQALTTIERYENRKRKKEELSNIIKEDGSQQKHQLKSKRKQVEKKNYCMHYQSSLEIAQKIKKKSILFELWKEKCSIFRLNQMKGRIHTQNKIVMSKKIEESLTIIKRQKIDFLGPQEIVAYEILYQQNRSLLSEKNSKIKQSIESLNLSLEMTKKLIDASLQVQMLTKLYFVLSTHGQNPTKSLQQSLQQSLDKYYKQYKNYPFYWRICLAKYLSSKASEIKFQCISRCIESLKNSQFDNKHLYLRYELIYQEYQKFINRFNGKLPENSKIFDKISRKSSISSGKSSFFLRRQSSVISQSSQVYRQKQQKAFSVIKKSQSFQQNPKSQLQNVSIPQEKSNSQIKENKLKRRYSLGSKISAPPSLKKINSINSKAQNLEEIKQNEDEIDLQLPMASKIQLNSRKKSLAIESMMQSKEQINEHQVILPQRQDMRNSLSKDKPQVKSSINKQINRIFSQEIVSNQAEYQLVIESRREQIKKNRERKLNLIGSNETKIYSRMRMRQMKKFLNPEAFQQQ